MNNNELENTFSIDYKIPDTIDDTISQMKAFPNQNSPFIASSGWDGRLRLWSVNVQKIDDSKANINSKLEFTTQLSEPILSLDWKPDIFNIILGAADGSVNLVDVTTSKLMTIGKHEIGAAGVFSIQNDNLNLILSGGWDGLINFYDLRSQYPVFTYNTKRRIVKMGMTYPLLVVANTERTLSYFNLQKLISQTFKEELTFESHLKYQTSSLTTFSEPNGYLIGSVEGRVAVKHIDLSIEPKLTGDSKLYTRQEDYAFRCHRMGDLSNEIYPVNCLASNYKYGTFASGGSDGSIGIWDKIGKSRKLTTKTQDKSPITAIEYSYDGDLLYYAYGYDWHKGISFEGIYKPGISIHYLSTKEKICEKK